MFELILLFVDLIFFLLAFAFLIIDFKNYEAEQNHGFKSTVLSKHSQYALLFGLLALVLAVLNSLFYV